MQLKDEILKNIHKMDIDELLYMKTIIRNINKKKSKKVRYENNEEELTTIREILKNSNLSGDIETLRMDRI